MLKSHLRVILLGFRRQPGYTALNVVGLAVGVACCLFLLLYVQDERSYDRFHEDAEQVFRINALPQPDREIVLTPAHVADLLVAEVPAVESAARLYPNWGIALMRAGETVFEEDGLFFADPSVFDVMTYAFVSGDPATALARPNTVVLTESTARRYFGEASPIGETVTRNDFHDLEVTGVIEDVPTNAHLRFDFLAALNSPDAPPEWGTANYHTYVRTHNASSAAAFPGQLGALVARLEADAFGQEPWGLRAIPITDIHLYSEVEGELEASGSIRVVYGFATVALLILLIACINYMNLATARASRRAEEVGLRKSLGALRGQLVAQFYGESAFLTLGGLVLALALVAIGLPAFNAISGKALAFGALASPGLLALIVGIFGVVSVVAGSYPAFLLSGFDPVRALRGGPASGRGPSRLRQGLVVLQFGISAVLIAGTLVVLSQLRYLAEKDVGFDREHIVALPLLDPVLQQAYPAMEEAIAQSPSVVSVAALNQIPGEVGWGSTMRGNPDDEEGFPVKGMPADATVNEGLGLQFVAGGGFPDNLPAFPDTSNYLFLVNEATVRQLGTTPEAVIGRSVRLDGRRGEVRGVVKDFHYQSMHAAIEPLAIWYQPDQVANLVVRFAPGRAQAGMDHVETVWGQFASHRPFSYRFLDDVYDGLYRSEHQLGRVVSVFAFLAVFVACLGLFGLAAFTAQQRTKEIGVRKVLGATVPHLVALLTKDFVGLVGVAFLVAMPLAWIGVDRWLDGFAYHIGLGPVPFVGAGVLLLAVALATVSTQALRAATADPIRALRSE